MMSSALKKLEGKVAIVTGGASGMGEETARCFSSHGAKVVIADIQDEKGRDLVESIGSCSCTYVRCNVTDEQQVMSLVQSTLQLYGKLDIMFSNAGVFSSVKQDILDFDVSAFERLFAINVKGMALCVKHGARAMVNKDTGGSIICTASIAATTGSDEYMDYTMSKHAVLGLVRSASKQLGAHGIRVNCVSPGGVATPMVSNYLGRSKEEIERLFEPTSSLKGVLKAKHVADAVVFLASEDSAFVTGHNLVIDGGLSTQ
ncbi:(-)-isopiperitenol/(-)-carveol dehydrogenase, mitochondrial-like [Rhodamnia argentea]|uniref:(-)-isopiperitenol/(-)-carveol dehydrogenase, mitochondrial-like n=1 Tax=Rhodamnia argentea TaxID=178133 RepID=A0A8B8P991_9MYRT|nr:(-)-isopiperitenol/(-)-carveol dehydrogenase, mitochondrial-like [Rhodamnia argentea]